ncbi:hypothetical protein [Nibricoccus sp. IMCC34717]|uniref:hypothetical protein n=1 Tax=Nibricoccus sp. IMCC34717 TaxID=3034021 RepID=UPI003850566B
MHIGVDLDNTLISYDSSFHAAAVELLAMPSETPSTKAAVKEYVQAKHGNDTWTRLQAEVYGPRIHAASPFPGVDRFLNFCDQAGHSVSVLSHKTRHAAAGGAYDLHHAALEWLQRQQWFSGTKAGLDRSRVYFFPTRLEKVRAIQELGCDLFIDDLPEIFADFAYPSEVPGIVFRPATPLVPAGKAKTCDSWSEITTLLFGTK